MGRRYPGGPFDPFEQSPFSGLQEFRIPRPPRRVWIGLAFVGGGILLLFVAAPLIGFVTETQWFQALGLSSVYLTRVAIQAWLFFGGLAVALAFTFGNLLVALRLRGGAALRAVGIRRRTLLSGAGLAGGIASILISLVLAGSLRSSWTDLALFLHYTPTGVREPVFSQDVSFYLITLPFLQSVAGWVLGLIFLSALLVAVLYAWRGESFDLRFSTPALAHLSALLGLLALVIAFSTFLDRYTLLYQHNGAVWGAGYTDVNARAPVAVLRTILAILLAGLLFANVALRRQGLIIAAVGIWVAASVVGGIYPALVQRVTVQPSELSQESPYISREIEFTRRAFSVDQVQTRPFNGDQPVTAKAIADDRATIDNLRLWDPAQLQETYTQLQSIRTYYAFEKIDVDRYTINGKTQQLEISARELDQNRLPQQAQSWVNQKLQYTHGYGVAASPVSAVVGEGLPDYVAKDLPPTGPLQVTRPEIYFGHSPGGYVLAPSVEKEFDYPQGNLNVRNSYQGTHGVKMDGGNRVLWSMRTGDFNLLVSSQIQDRTQILYRRDVGERVQAIAPFLTFDSPYITVVDGRLYWIVDGYTSANSYPYSQQEPGADNQNYLRNSVKVVVDAYSGTTDFYVVDNKDPLIRAYQATFPGFFKPLNQMPEGLQAHLRVPPKLFAVQAAVYTNYHISDPATFYNREDVWDVPAGLSPYYVEMRLPGSPQAEYLQILPFTPFRKQNLVSWLAVRNDAPHYGEMVSFVLPKDKVVFGPQQVASRIQQTPEISRDRTLLNSQGSSVIEGNLLVVPVGDSFLYFEPWYLKSTTSNQSLPELKKVILTDATETGSVAYQNNLADALNQLAGQQVATPSQPSAGPTTGPAVSPTVANLITQALQHYNAAQDALKQGDLATYAREMAQVGSLLQQIDAYKGAASPSPSASPSSRASPSSSPRASP
jgi:uncharacterized membrane protein (UPF0182 family)